MTSLLTREEARRIATRAMLTFAACPGVYLINTRTRKKKSQSGVEATICDTV